MKKFLALLGLLFAVSINTAAQTAIPITNPSFEISPSLPNNNTEGPWGYGAPQGWSFSGSGGAWQPTADPCAFPSVPDGKTVMWINGGTLSQATSSPVQPNTIYKLTVYVGHRNCFSSNSYTLSLLVNGVILGGCSLTDTNVTIPLHTFIPVTLTCTTGSSVPTGNIAVSMSSAGTEVNFDNISLTYLSLQPPVPSVVLNINSGSSAIYDDASAILPGPVMISQLQNPTTTVGIGTITSDANGNLSGSLTVNPNWTDTNGNLTFLFGLPILPNVISYPVPVGEFQHNSTGLTINLVLFKQGALAIKSQTLAVTP